MSGPKRARQAGGGKSFYCKLRAKRANRQSASESQKVMIEKADQKYVVTGTVDAYESIVSYQPTEILEITSEERQQPNESD